MLNFLRKFRRQNMNSKYLKYAIGEIILVVIGILIALRINNWNERRKELTQMTENLYSLKEDLKTDSTNFSRSISAYEQYINQKMSFWQKDLNSIPTDSLMMLIQSNTSESKPNLTTYQKVVNSPVISFSSNRSLSRRINAYYTSLLTYHNDMLNYENNYAMKSYSYWVLEQNMFEAEFDLDLPILQQENERRKGILSVLNSVQGRNYIKEDYQRKVRLRNHYQLMINQCSRLIEAINEELED